MMAAPEARTAKKATSTEAPVNCWAVELDVVVVVETVVLVVVVVVVVVVNGRFPLMTKLCPAEEKTCNFFKLDKEWLPEP
jgi:hypothetical protein